MWAELGWAGRGAQLWDSLSYLLLATTVKKESTVWDGRQQARGMERYFCKLTVILLVLSDDTKGRQQPRRNGRRDRGRQKLTITCVPSSCGCPAFFATLSHVLQATYFGLDKHFLTL